MVLHQFLLLPLLLASSVSCAIPVWPIPTESSYGDTAVVLSPSFKIVQADSGGGEGQYYKHSSSGFSVSSILSSAITRTESTIVNTKFIPWKFHPRNESFEPSFSSCATISTVTIYQKSSKNQTKLAEFVKEDESYTLELSTNGTAAIYSNAPIGTIRGLQTLEQLFYASSTGHVYTPYAPISITDSPKWSHRGLNLDVCRNVFSPNDVKRTLEAMSTAKFSRLHIHITDSQSWPLVIPSLPTLAAKGAYQPSLVWKPEDLASVQQYGLERGISVFIEIDMPGHTASVAHAFPDLIAAFNNEDWSTFAAEPPSGQLKLNSPAVPKFIDTLLGDLLPRLSPYTSYFHTGGDELNKNVYLLDETVMSNSSDIIQPLLQKFVSHAQSLVQEQGLQPIAWEEMILDWNLTLTPANSSKPATIVQVWQSPANLLAVLQKGYKALFGDYTEWYLDCGHGQWLNPYVSGYSPPGIPVNTSGGVPTALVEPFTDYCSPLKNWRHVYIYDPLVNITSDLQPLIEGGEVHMWSEQNDPISMDGIIWPRAAAAAEVLWSGPRNSSQLLEATTRLGQWRERAVLDHGISSGTVSMNICLMGENSCVL